MGQPYESRERPPGPRRGFRVFNFSRGSAICSKIAFFAILFCVLGFVVWAHNTCIGPYRTLQVPAGGYQKHHIGQDAAMLSLQQQGYKSSAAPAIGLFGGGSDINTAHGDATAVQRAENQTLLDEGKTQMTIQQEAGIAHDALEAAKTAPLLGPAGGITEYDIVRALDAFWAYVKSIGATAKSLIRIPTR